MKNVSRAGAALAGLKVSIPMVPPVIPFGLILGYSITQAPLDPFVGWTSSWTIFGGASQLAAVNLVVEGASAVVIVSTVAIINARHFLYSAALNDRLDSLPRWFRVVASYILIDQVFAIIEALPRDTPKERIMWLWLGAGSSFWLIWQVSVAVGVVFGDILPTSWSLNFVVPLMFGGLMVLSIRSSAGVAAAVVGGSVAVAAAGLPQGLGLVAGIVAGVAAGALVERRNGVPDA